MNDIKKKGRTKAWLERHPGTKTVIVALGALVTGALIGASVRNSREVKTLRQDVDNLDYEMSKANEGIYDICCDIEDLERSIANKKAK